MVLLPHLVFTSARDSSNDDFYLFKLKKKITPEWRLAHYRANAYFTKAKIAYGINTAFITTLDGIDPAYYYRSLNRGEEWENYSTVYDFYAFRPVSDTLLYACTNEKLYKSTDGGDSWTELGDFSSSYTIFGVPTELLFLTQNEDAQGRIIIVFDEGSTIHTTDEGSSFSRHNSTLGSIEKTIIYNKGIMAFSAHQNAVSTNNGVTWNTPVTISTKTFQDAVISLKRKNEIVISADDQIFVSDNEGTNWKEATTNSDGKIIHSLAYDEEDNFFGSNETDGIFYKIRNYGELIDSYQFNDNSNIKVHALNEILPYEGTKYQGKVRLSVSKKAYVTQKKYTAGPITTLITRDSTTKTSITKEAKIKTIINRNSLIRKTV